MSQLSICSSKIEPSKKEMFLGIGAVVGGGLIASIAVSALIFIPKFSEARLLFKAAILSSSGLASISLVVIGTVVIAKQKKPNSKDPIYPILIDQNYQPIREGMKAGFHKLMFYEGKNGIKIAFRYLCNKVSLISRKLFPGDNQHGFKKESFKEWKPSKESLGIGIERNLTPYELAQALGFSKSANQIQEELEAVPTRVAGGFLFEGEYENSKEELKNQLGLAKQSSAANTPFSEALGLDAGVNQGYCVGTHSMLVVRMFDQHLAMRFEKNKKFEGICTAQEFRLFLMLHDIGKGLAVKKEGNFETAARKQFELQYCRDAIDEVVKCGIISQNTGNYFNALLENVTLGELMKGNITEEEAVKQLHSALEKNNISKLNRYQFFSLCKIFHIADSGAYKNIRRIHGLFEVHSESKKLRHAKNIPTGQGLKVKNLKTAFLK